jgi:hypothetical protein
MASLEEYRYHDRCVVALLLCVHWMVTSRLLSL